MRKFNSYRIQKTLSAAVVHCVASRLRLKVNSRSLQTHRRSSGPFLRTTSKSDSYRHRFLTSSSGTFQHNSMVSWSVLRQQDDCATAAALKVLDSEKYKDGFRELAASETQDILDRDNKDAEALKVGIKFAQSKGVLPVQTTPPAYTQVDVRGKDADTVSNEILTKIGESNLAKGCVMVLVGLSGTGKGTTVSKMKEEIEKRWKATAWSNGNLFRCLTLLACEFVEKLKATNRAMEPGEYAKEIDATDSILSAENLDLWVKKHLKFEKRSDIGKWDIQLTRLDGQTKLWVSEICNTLLKEPRISKAIPFVAAKTQGEVDAGGTTEYLLCV